MRLRRLEIVVIGVTLAFALFMGGFFTGRSWSAVNIMPVTQQREEPQNPGSVSVQLPDTTSQSGSTAAASETTTNEASQAESTATANEAPVHDASTEAVGVPRSGDGKININLASQSELTDLPGIGSVLASRIIDYRRQHGDFLRIEDLRNVSGIGEKRYEAIMDKITVG
ncbi:MAG: helix-hairpin-helix domain-containing protein [Oscillospiraceae bacterium]|nr:helix-hairpin-helix domain-containing protein [Oscillospiraceae bacterium]